MRKIAYAFMWLTITIALGLMLTFIYWLVYPYKTAEFKLPFEVMNENKIVMRGERLRYKIDYCKYTDQMPDVTKFFIDGVIYETPASPGLARIGCNVDISDVYVPRAIPPGKYSLKIVARYKLNPIRTIEIVNYTEPFTVK